MSFAHDQQRPGSSNGGGFFRLEAVFWFARALVLAFAFPLVAGSEIPRFRPGLTARGEGSAWKRRRFEAARETVGTQEGLGGRLSGIKAGGEGSSRRRGTWKLSAGYEEVA